MDWCKGPWLLIEGAWNRLVQIRFLTGWRVKGLERRKRNLNSGSTS